MIDAQAIASGNESVKAQLIKWGGRDKNLE